MCVLTHLQQPQPQSPHQARKPLHPPKRAKRNPRKKKTVVKRTMIRKRKTARTRTTSRPDNVWRPNARRLPLRGESNVRKRPVQLLARKTSAVQFAVSLDMSIRVRPNCLIRSVWFYPVDQDGGADVPLDSTNQRARGRGWRYHPANRCDVLPR